MDGAAKIKVLKSVGTRLLTCTRPLVLFNSVLYRRDVSVTGSNPCPWTWNFILYRRDGSNPCPVIVIRAPPSTGDPCGNANDQAARKKKIVWLDSFVSTIFRIRDVPEKISKITLVS